MRIHECGKWHWCFLIQSICVCIWISILLVSLASKKEKRSCCDGFKGVDKRIISSRTWGGVGSCFYWTELDGLLLNDFLLALRIPDWLAIISASLSGLVLQSVDSNIGLLWDCCTSEQWGLTHGLFSWAWMLLREGVSPASSQHLSALVHLLHFSWMLPHSFQNMLYHNFL